MCSKPAPSQQVLTTYQTTFCETGDVEADIGRGKDQHREFLVRTFERALKATGNLTGKVQNGFLTRLERVRNIGRKLGYGVGDDMGVLFAESV